MLPKMGWGGAEHLQTLVHIFFFFSEVHEVLTSRWCIVASSSTGTINNSAENQSHSSHAESPRPDFGDGANPLWSLFFKQAKTQDEAEFHSLMETMNGGLVFVRVPPRIMAATIS